MIRLYLAGKMPPAGSLPTLTEQQTGLLPPWDPFADWQQGPRAGAWVPNFAGLRAGLKQPAEIDPCHWRELS